MTSLLRPALLVTGKDLRERLRDRSAYIWGLLAPFGLAFIFSRLFGDFGAGAVTFDLAVLDADGGPLARAFVEEVLPAVERDGFAHITVEDDEQDAIAAVEAGTYDALLVIPRGFSEAVASGRAAEIDVVGSADARFGTQVAEAIASDFAQRLTATQVAVAAARTRGLPSDAAVALANRLPDVVAVDVARTARRELDGPTYLSAGMAVFFLFFTVQFGVTGLLEERRLGTLQRLFAAPVPRAAVYLGKVLTSLVLGVVSMAVLLLASAALLGADFGDPVAVAVLVLAGVTAAAAIVALVAAVAHTPDQANAWQSIVAVVLGMLGGAFFPIAQEGLLTTVSLLTPHQWFLRGLADLSGDGGIADVVGPVLAMLGFAVVIGAVAVWRWRRRALLT